MPQLDFAEYPHQIFWLIVTFGFLYVILAKNFLPRIAAVLEQRRDTIDHDLQKARQLREESEQALKAYEEALHQARAAAQATAAEVRKEIAQVANEQEAKANKKIAKRLAEAEAEISSMKDKAAAELPMIAKEVAHEVAAQYAPNMDVAKFDRALKSAQS